MAAAAMALLLLFTISQFLPPASCSPPSNYKHHHCDWCPRHSTASLLPPAAADLDGKRGGEGACGYGAAMATELNGGYVVTAAGAEFFRDGAGCGACYQVGVTDDCPANNIGCTNANANSKLRCRDRRVCGDGGVKVVVVTDAANSTGFVLAGDAFAAMAKDGMAGQLAGSDNVVPVDFRRIPCEYKKNLTVRVEEGSRNPGHLAVRFLYQGGQTDIAAVEIAQADRTRTQQSWRPMARLRRVWRATRAPAGPLRLRLVVTAGFGGKWLRTQEAVLPADWRPGQAYDTGLRVTDVALRTCTRSCRARHGAGDEELR
ncbi:expansin-like A4 isoform X2 [Panicum miliaceum]|uniref:Expansin-like A4 isoform X2 n=1 Tax=Panicum miliaceum TaxID=4540 RepID=A0A3L6RXY7_PANMI|nr:expansin-like A4 isoform X2 [Panicum miliaceum]